jgi:multiple sugar transport system substrate-binding protein
MKKTSLWIMAIVLCLSIIGTFSLFGCADTSEEQEAGEPVAEEPVAEEPAAEEQVTEAAEPIEMVWANFSGLEASPGPVIDRIIFGWNENNPDAIVKSISWPWSEMANQLIIRSQGGEALDIAQIDLNMIAALNEADILVDLNTVIEGEYFEENFQESAVGVGNIRDKQIGFPWTVASIGMVYNPSLLEGAGVESVPETIEEFEEACRALKEKYPDIIPYGAVTKDPASMAKDFGTWIWTFGGSIFDEDGNVVINSSNCVEALTWFKGMLDKGYIAMDSSRYDMRVYFANQRVGFYEDAIACDGILRTNMELDAGANVDEYIKPMLKPVLSKGDEPQSVMWGMLLAVSQNAQNKEKAAEFLKHVVKEENALDFFNSCGMLPVKKSALESNTVQNSSWATKWSEITATGKMAETAAYPSTSQMDTIITEEVQEALLGSKTPQEALDSAKVRLESVLAE